ncbi:hypothetical protein D3C84_605450 [compost metagenome]
MQFVDRLGADDRASGADRVAEGNTRAIRVDLQRIHPKFLSDGAGLGGKGLIGFDYIHLFHAQAAALQHQTYRRHRPHAHIGWVDACVGIANQAG